MRAGQVYLNIFSFSRIGHHLWIEGILLYLRWRWDGFLTFGRRVYCAGQFVRGYSRDGELRNIRQQSIRYGSFTITYHLHRSIAQGWANWLCRCTTTTTPVTRIVPIRNSLAPHQIRVPIKQLLLKWGLTMWRTASFTIQSKWTILGWTVSLAGTSSGLGAGRLLLGLHCDATSGRKISRNVLG